MPKMIEALHIGPNVHKIWAVKYKGNQLISYHQKQSGHPKAMSSGHPKTKNSGHPKAMNSGHPKAMSSDHPIAMFFSGTYFQTITKAF